MQTTDPSAAALRLLEGWHVAEAEGQSCLALTKAEAVQEVTTPSLLAALQVGRMAFLEEAAALVRQPGLPP